jgi:hypothetical protein
MHGSGRGRKLKQFDFAASKMCKELPIENRQTPEPDHASVIQIRIKGHLGRQWADWFDGMAITLENNGDTLLTGPVADQSTLHGLLKKVRDLGLPLVSVNPLLPNEANISKKLKTPTNVMHANTEKEKK